RAILVERFAEDADLTGLLRERLWKKGRLGSTVREGKEEVGAKFSDYFDFSEPLTDLPSHRVLALYRGEKEEILTLTLVPEEPPEPNAQGKVPRSSYENAIAAHFDLVDRGRPADRWLQDTVRWAWRTRILVRLDIDVRMRLWQQAEDEGVGVFAANLRDLLLAAPAGNRATLGLDPGLRTGVKVAVTDTTGKVVATDTIFPHAPRRDWDGSVERLAKLCAAHAVELIAIGNGTASRETDKLVGDLIKRHPERKLTKVMVSEACASVYSASTYASEELPDLDVSLRGAASIARRLQDPLAELVKIDPKSIGVGQYQHDLAETKLSRSLDAVVEDCVNGVGVDVNTASVPLLTRVSGITSTLARNIVAHRDTNGPFRTRKELRSVPRLGPKAFEQCAGFLRISSGDDPLDASAVHPEAYPVVRRILDATDTDLSSLIGNKKVLSALRPKDFVDDTFGLPTVTDILSELDKPGRDPRPAFTTATFKEGVEELSDLEQDMILEGVVTNVAAFGAFVDVGVHQDGLVHVSAMSRKFVKDPHDIVKPGDIVKVKVQDVDISRKRISLTMRLDDEAPSGGGSGRSGRDERGGGRKGGAGHGRKRKAGRQERAPQGAMADALRRAGLTGQYHHKGRATAAGRVALACPPRGHLGERGTSRHSRRTGVRSVACSSSISFHTLTGVASVVTAGHPGSPVAAKSCQAVTIRSDSAVWMLLGVPSSRNAAKSVSRLPKEEGRSNAWQAPSRPPRAGLSAARRKTWARPPPLACVSARRTVNSLNIASPMIAV